MLHEHIMAAILKCCVKSISNLEPFPGSTLKLACYRYSLELTDLHDRGSAQAITWNFDYEFALLHNSKNEFMSRIHSCRSAMYLNML